MAVHSTRRTILAGAASLVASATLASPAPGPVELPPYPGRAVLKVVANGREAELELRDIEGLGLRRVRTRSPWEDGSFTFEGVLLRDVLKHAGLGDAKAVRVRASDDYIQTIPREDWVNAPVLLATRQDGQPMTRRMQGPTRIVYPLDDHPELDTPLHKPRWV